MVERTAKQGGGAVDELVAQVFITDGIGIGALGKKGGETIDEQAQLEQGWLQGTDFTVFDGNSKGLFEDHELWDGRVVGSTCNGAA